MENEEFQASRIGNWKAISRVIAKAALLFVLLNVLFAALKPVETLGRFSLYNWLLAGRERLPYGENAADSYNLSLNNVPAMMASHTISQPKKPDEFRVIVIGDSGTWGWLLENDETLAGQINQGNYQTADGRMITAYNLGYPIMALSKDLLILDAAMAHEPDLIIWPVTLASFSRDRQLEPPLVTHNPERMRSLISDYDLSLDPEDPRFDENNLYDETIIGRRRDLADLLRLQLYGFSWSATKIDQVYPEEITLRRSDFEEDLSWEAFENPVALSGDDLAIDHISAGLAVAGDVPVLIINEPIFISEGINSDFRYNAWYPRWAYDQYRDLLSAKAGEEGWNYLDLWDTTPGANFTDSPVHLDGDGTARLLENILSHIQALSGEQ